MKNKTKHSIIKIAVGIVVLVASGLLGTLTGTFKNFGEVIGVVTIDIDRVFKILIMAAFVYSLYSLIQLFLHTVRFKGSRSQTVVTVLSSLSRYVAIIAGIFWGLALLGVDIGTLFASVGIIALIIGFGAESLVADVVTGAFILFENQYNVGDIVELDGYRGTVDSIGIRTTGIRDAGGNIKIVNNSDIKNIINRSEHGSVAVATVGVSYGADLTQIEAKIPGILTKIKEAHPDVFIGNVRYLGVDELADSSVVLKFVAEVDEANIFSGKRLLNRELKVCFDEAGIEIAYPQLDVHMR